MHLQGYEMLDISRVITKLYTRVHRNKHATGFHVNKDMWVYYYVHLCQTVRPTAGCGSPATAIRITQCLYTNQSHSPANTDCWWHYDSCTSLMIPTRQAHDNLSPSPSQSTSNMTWYRGAWFKSRATHRRHVSSQTFNLCVRTVPMLLAGRPRSHYSIPSADKTCCSSSKCTDRL